MNLNHKAATVYDRALETGQPFSVRELVEELTSNLLDDEHDVTELVSAAADQAIRRVDKERTGSAPQSSLFDLLDQAVPIAAGRRLARRDMRFGDWAAHLGHVSENAGRVNASAAKENQRFTALSPYLTAGLNTEQATKAWSEDHPDGLLP